MIKLTNTFLIGLIATGLLVGCGSNGSDNDIEANEGTSQVDNSGTDMQPVEPNNGNGAGNTPPPPMTTSAKTFAADVMPILNAKCKTCHGSNGNFTITDASMTHANIMALPGGAKYMLNKGNGDVGHGGGDRLIDNEYATIKSWVDAGAANN